MFASIAIILWGLQSVNFMVGYFDVIASQGFQSLGYAPYFHLYAISAFLALACLLWVQFGVRRLFSTEIKSETVLRLNLSVASLVAIGGYGLWVLGLTYVHMMERNWYGR